MYVRLSNLRDSSATLSWTTDEATTGYVLYGETADKREQVAYDNRGATTSSTTHFVVLDNLTAETTYHFEIMSGSQVAHSQSITTAPSLEGLPQSDTIYGQLFQADGETAATGTLVYLTLQDADGTGSEGEAGLLAAVVDSSGYWQANLGNARSADGSPFDYSASGSQLLIDAQGIGTTSQTIDTAHDSPAPDMTLDEADEPTSITVADFNTTPSIPLLGRLLLSLALTISAALFVWPRATSEGEANEHEHEREQ